MDMDIVVAERARHTLELWVHRQLFRHGRWILNDSAWLKRLARKRVEAFEEAMRELGA